jgi:hypothetical protein
VKAHCGCGARGAAPLVAESDAPNGYLAVHENTRLVIVDPTLTSVKFVRTSDCRGGRARLSVRTDLPLDTTGTIGARLADATGQRLRQRGILSGR